MAITKISRLHEYRIFRDFSWPSDLLEFKEFNLIYGWNGSGKSTLGSLLRHLELRTKCNEGRVKISIDNVAVEGDAFDTVSECVRVFNRDFISDTVFSVNESVAPIYIIGKGNVEKQKKVKDLKKKLKTTQGKVISNRTAHEQAKREEDNLCVDKARFIKDTIGGGGNNFSNYNKRSFRQRISAFKNKEIASASKMSDQQRADCLMQAQSSPKPLITEHTYDYPDLVKLASEVTVLLERTVVSTTISGLQESPSIVTWVRDGIALHKEQETSKCLYCTQPLPPERIEALDKHFSNAFEQLQTDLDAKISRLQSELDSWGCPFHC